MTTTTKTAYDRILTMLEEEGFKLRTYTSDYRTKGHATGPTVPAHVIQAKGTYGAPYRRQPATITIWFAESTRAFIRWDIHVAGSSFSGFPNTVKALLEDDGFGAPLLHSISPKRNDALMEQRKLERLNRNEYAQQQAQDKAARLAGAIEQFHIDLIAEVGSRARRKLCSLGLLERYVALRAEVTNDVTLKNANIDVDALLRALQS